MHDEGSRLRDGSLVSVLIPSYHSGEKLIRAIDSVLRQSYRPLQLIVCDDGTEDFDSSAVEGYIAERANKVDFAVFHQAENLGTVRNLNTALVNAAGGWIIPLAADDVFGSEQAVSKLVRQISGSGHRWLIARTELCSERMEQSGQVVPSEADLALISEGDVQAIYHRLCESCFLPSSGAVYERRLLDEAGGFDEHYQLVEDWPLYLKLIRLNHIPAVSDEVCVLHGDGGTSRHRAGKNQRYQQDLIQVMEREILLHMELLGKDKQREICRTIEMKRAVYQYRFASRTVGEKLGWIITHPGVLARKLVKRG